MIKGIFFGFFFGFVVGFGIGFLIEPGAGPIVYGSYAAILCALLFGLLFRIGVNNARIRYVLNKVVLFFFIFISAISLSSIVFEIFKFKQQ